VSGWCGSPVAMTHFNGERPVPPNHERSRPDNPHAEGQCQNVKNLRADGTLILLAIPNLVKDLERPQFGMTVSLDSGTVSGAAEVTPVEPGQAPLHHEAFQVTCASAACPLRLGWK
jgi:hypothetical protein